MTNTTVDQQDLTREIDFHIGLFVNRFYAKLGAIALSIIVSALDETSSFDPSEVTERSALILTDVVGRFTMLLMIIPKDTIEAEHRVALIRKKIVDSLVGTGMNATEASLDLLARMPATIPYPYSAIPGQETDQVSARVHDTCDNYIMQFFNHVVITKNNDSRKLAYGNLFTRDYIVESLLSMPQNEEVTMI